jgi:uncharacterized membrane protein YbaN (DUF454 family)
MVTMQQVPENQPPAAKADSAVPGGRPAWGDVLPIWKRQLLLVAAAVFLGLGLLGAVLPGLPCTPFVLLTSYCLARSSPRLNAALHRSRLFGPLIRDWQHRGGIRRRVKYQSIAVVIIVVAASLLLGAHSLLLASTIGALAMIGIVIILRLPEVEGRSSVVVADTVDGSANA